MLKRFLGQKKVPWVGGFKETLSQVLWWGTPVNFIMLAATFFYTTLREIAPWFDFLYFILIVVIGVIIVFVLEYKFIVPSIWEFRGRQMFKYESEIKGKLDEIIERLGKLEEKDDNTDK